MKFIEHKYDDNRIGWWEIYKEDSGACVGRILYITYGEDIGFVFRSYYYQDLNYNQMSEITEFMKKLTHICDL